MKKFLGVLMMMWVGWLPFAAQAWDDAGHEIVAAEAYRQLSPEVRAQVFAILQAHPAFAAWQERYHPQSGMDLPATIFLCSATWPDEVRGSGSPYDHAAWHFVDYPLRPPNFPLEPDPQPTNDILYGIAQCESALGNVHAGAELRAVYLSYLIHLVGDIHQPLHCENYFGDGYPTGDRGGNNFFVRLPDSAAGTGLRLHGFWDGLLDAAGDRRAQWDFSAQLMAKFPRPALPELAAATTPTAWSLESRRLTIHFGYLDGRLPGSSKAVTAPALPSGYTNAAAAVAQRQVALAGYRLANEIQTFLKWDRELPPLMDNPDKDAVTGPAKIGVNEASKYYDETVTVTGRVSQVTVSANVAIVRFEQRAGAVPFTAVIFKEHLVEFGDVQQWRGRHLEINGTVREYHRRAEIVVEGVGQVRRGGDE